MSDFEYLAGIVEAREYQFEDDRSSKYQYYTNKMRILHKFNISGVQFFCNLPYSLTLCSWITRHSLSLIFLDASSILPYGLPYCSTVQCHAKVRRNATTHVP